ncbi:MAG: MerR family transcriptional regulator [Acidipropionibacterium sp.]|jgi:DNA-binding transcriptional MerR regulator|nr:MerR family transcriptional regulator [Acidipropionibacterium sp.]
MSTEALIEQLLSDAADVSGDSAVATLHALLDDSTIEDDAAPIGIAEAADLVGLTPHTLRYYEQQGLTRPGRDASGYRAYSAADLRRLVFLARMRLSGMPMRELRRYIGLVEQGDATTGERRAIMIEQRERIRRRVRELNLALAATEYKIRTYGGHP